MALPSQEYLHECFTYYPSIGALVWNTRPVSHFASVAAANRWNARWAETEAFTTVDSDGYLTGCLNGKGYKAHRIIYKMLYDLEPEQIDHDDHNRQNNRPNNLNAATNQSNLRNQSKRVTNTSGVTGVCFENTKQRWRVQLGNKFLGYFDTFEAAVQARKAAQNQSGYHINHGV